MHRNEKGFTLMELMVVIVIVAILAAVAVPLYINYVKDAQRTEAKAAIGAIATAEQAYFLKSPNLNPGQPATYGDLNSLQTEGLVDIRDAEAKWNISVTNVSTTTYTVQASYRTDASIQVEYRYIQGSGGQFFDTVTP
jgi:prepilin-type N-terminal cleavage/methylation domain-containing protein